MMTFLKTVFLFVSILVVMPVIFFFLVAYFGKFFSISVNKNSIVERLRRD